MTALLRRLLLLTVLAGCDSSSEPVVIAGDYQSTIFTVTEDGTVTDLLSVGASLDLTLSPPMSDVGTFEGRLEVPPGEGRDGVSVLIDGTYDVLERSTSTGRPSAVLTFQTSADLFVRDRVWYVTELPLATRLATSPSLGEGGISVSLERR